MGTGRCRSDSGSSCRAQVPSERFQSACEELRQALGREQEAQALIQEQTNQLQALQRRADTLSSEQTDAQRTLSQTQQVTVPPGGKITKHLV